MKPKMIDRLIAVVYFEFAALFVVVAGVSALELSGVIPSFNLFDIVKPMLAIIVATAAGMLGLDVIKRV